MGICDFKLGENIIDWLFIIHTFSYTILLGNFTFCPRDNNYIIYLYSESFIFPQSRYFDCYYVESEKDYPWKINNNTRFSPFSGVYKIFWWWLFEYTEWIKHQIYRAILLIILFADAVCGCVTYLNFNQRNFFFFFLHISLLPWWIFFTCAKGH